MSALQHRTFELEAVPVVCAAEPPEAAAAWVLPAARRIRRVEARGRTGGAAVAPAHVDVLEVIPVMGNRLANFKGTIASLDRAARAAHAAHAPLHVVVHVVVQCASAAEDALEGPDSLPASARAIADAINCAEGSALLVVVTTLVVPGSADVHKALLMNVGVCLGPAASWYMLRDADFMVHREYYTAIGGAVRAASEHGAAPPKEEPPAWWYPRPADMSWRVTTREQAAAWILDGDDGPALTASVVPPMAAHAPGGAVAVRADVFWDVGGLNHACFVGYSAEDLEFAMALRRRCGVLQRARGCPTAPPSPSAGLVSAHLWHASAAEAPRSGTPGSCTAAANTAELVAQAFSAYHSASPHAFAACSAATRVHQPRLLRDLAASLQAADG
jgi:hypothetical protein